MTILPRPDVGFVLSSLRRDAGAAQMRRDAAARVEDWAAVARLALAHDVGWWVVRALPADGVPDPVRAQLDDAVRGVTLAALAGAGQLAELCGALENAGVRAVAFKGPALAADVHGDVGARWFTDLDVLIAMRDRAAARRALMDIGYSPPAGYTAREERFYSTWEGVSHFTRDGGGVPVEVHWRVQAPRYGIPQDPAPVVAEARRCAMGGGVVPVPALEVQAVLIALHGVKHAWTSLLWVVDFVHAVARDGFDWVRFAEWTARWRVARAVYDALLVAHELVALEMPPDWLARARADTAAVRLASEAVRGLLSDAARPNAGLESTARYDLQWLPDTWARARYLALAAVLPTPADRRVARLPDAWLPLAYPVRAWRLLQHAMGRRG